jgi:2-oxoglutarate-dependent dioxygenase
MREESIHIFECLGTPRDRLNRAEASSDKLRQTTQYLAGSRIDALVNSPNLLAIAAQLLGGPSSLYMPFTAVKNGGGAGRFHFHQDNQYTRFTDGLGGINIWFAFNDMTPENGCLQVVPRSHLRGTLDPASSPDNDAHRMVKIEPKDFLPVRMRAGDAIAFTRLTVHGSGPNTTGEPRIAYATQFHRDDVMAIWDNQPPRPLKGAKRFNTEPVRHIGPVEATKSLDGH